MEPSDHHALFERLCLYRALYPRRGPQDRDGVLTVEAAIACAERLLADPGLLEATLATTIEGATEGHERS